MTDVQHTIESLLQQCEALPATDVAADLFGPKNYRAIMVPYFAYLVEHADDVELYRRLAATDLTGDPATVYWRINKGGHPVRDYLILKANGLT